MAKKKSEKILGVIGGSGLYDLEDLQGRREVAVKTPWGSPSDKIIAGTLGDVQIYFIPRHGKGHRFLPTEVPSQANICALKMLGARRVVAFSAVGSLKEKIAPRHFVVPDQIIDRTRSRANSFFGEGVVAHLPFGDPFCPDLMATVIRAIKKVKVTLHTQETLICMEGPLFSTRAESNSYRALGAGIINMSVLPEAKLAREAGLGYCMVCMSTDYDCWREHTEDVTLDMVLANLKANGDNAKRCLRAIAEAIDYSTETPAMGMVKTSIITAPEHRPAKTVKKLKKLLPEIF